MTRPNRACLGFGDRKGLCRNTAGTPWTHLWCPECDQKRLGHITQRMEAISASLAPSEEKDPCHMEEKTP